MEKTPITGAGSTPGARARRRRSRWLNGKFLATFLAGATLLGGGALVLPQLQKADAAQDDAPSRGMRSNRPEIDPKRAHQAAVDYLIRSGMTRSAAETRLKNQERSRQVARKLRAEAPGDFQSLYINRAGRLVANVVTERGAALARAAGVTPHKVTAGWKELTGIQEQLLASVKNSHGLSVGIDPKSGTVNVTYSSGFSAKNLASLRAKAKQYGDLVTVTKGAGTLRTTADVDPGSGFTSNGMSCTAGWGIDISALDPGAEGGSTRADGFMSAGHCLRNNEGIEVNDQDAGTAFNVHLGPEGDFGMVRLNAQFSSQPKLAFIEDPVTGVDRNPIVGTAVCKLGMTTDYTCGEITELSASSRSRMPDGTIATIGGLIRTNLCAQGGDSGGPVFAEAGSSVIAIGIVQGGRADKDGNCGERQNPPTPNSTNVQPIDPIVPEGSPYQLKLADDGSQGGGGRPPERQPRDVEPTSGSGRPPERQPRDVAGMLDNRLNYVALGDSFSAGTGAGPYLPNDKTITPVDGLEVNNPPASVNHSNNCQRSEQAYGPLTAKLDSLYGNVTVGDFTFAACAGAVTQNVLNGQLDALSSDTELVTLTIGGNDIRFADAMRECAKPVGLFSEKACSDALNISETLMMNLEGRLTETYQKVLAAAPNARLIVLGYPKLFDEQGSCTLTQNRINPFPNVRKRMNHSAETLSQVVQNAVKQAGRRVQFVDPQPAFDGHGVCSADPFITDPGTIGLLHTEDSYHPNAKGHQAYASLLKEAADDPVPANTYNRGCSAINRCRS